MRRSNSVTAGAIWRGVLHRPAVALEAHVVDPRALAAVLFVPRIRCRAQDARIVLEDIVSVACQHAQRTADHHGQRSGEQPDKQRNPCAVQHTAPDVAAHTVTAHPEGVLQRRAIGQRDVARSARGHADETGVHRRGVEGAEERRHRTDESQRQQDDGTAAYGTEDPELLCMCKCHRQSTFSTALSERLPPCPAP